MWLNVDQDPTINIDLSISFLARINNPLNRDKLFDPIHGLPVSIVTHPITYKIFVVLKNSINNNMEEFL